MELFSHALNYLRTIGFTDIIDIVIVAVLIFAVIRRVKRIFGNIFRIVAIFAIIMILVFGFKLKMVSFIIRKALEIGAIALLVVFQPEIRRAAERLGSSISIFRNQGESEIDRCISQVVLACSEMSASKTGALIVFERKINLNNVVTTQGTAINADTTAELLKNIFFNKAPLHDGAVIIKDGRIASAGCFLPLTHKQNLSKELGTRHHAGIGVSEASDAVVVIVSEETGAISAAIDGSLKRHLTSGLLDKLLREQLVSESSSDSAKSIKGILNRFRTVISNAKK